MPEAVHDAIHQVSGKWSSGAHALMRVKITVEVQGRSPWEKTEGRNEQSLLGVGVEGGSPRCQLSWSKKKKHKRGERSGKREQRMSTQKMNVTTVLDVTNPLGPGLRKTLLIACSSFFS